MEFSGVVAGGEGRGRRIGFPTANLQVDGQALRGLSRGVFSALATWGESEDRAAVVNIGSRPTFGGDGEVTVEVYILDYEGDLYGETVAVRLKEKLRDEQRFDSVEELRRQIARDVEKARVANP
ncbi:MAG TPA: riboflavin kinase [Candidatus Latescibacteria bacterium]|jgi:riboflavin kinase/FMN adenylyltransferase|nr:hypothetical protein [Gemmatimonadaceae bacterium]HJP30704.1 riboflavin kinase [Candidatus Latescibacterota bacterium]|tara:strand:- start:212 stop:583 length:372 start_codon:yes stop_codon:yes gene_type:complete